MVHTVNEHHGIVKQVSSATDSSAVFGAPILDWQRLRQCESCRAPILGELQDRSAQTAAALRIGSAPCTPASDRGITGQAERKGTRFMATW
jgi:hypothetical protein